MTSPTTLAPFASAVTGSPNHIPGKPEIYLPGSMSRDTEKERDCRNQENIYEEIIRKGIEQVLEL